MVDLVAVGLEPAPEGDTMPKARSYERDQGIRRLNGATRLPVRSQELHRRIQQEGVASWRLPEFPDRYGQFGDQRPPFNFVPINQADDHPLPAEDVAWKEVPVHPPDLLSGGIAVMPGPQPLIQLTVWEKPHRVKVVANWGLAITKTRAGQRSLVQPSQEASRLS
nr:hypothetical protein [Actinopolymorpha alba]